MEFSFATSGNTNPEGSICAAIQAEFSILFNSFLSTGKVGHPENRVDEGEEDSFQGCLWNLLYGPGNMSLGGKVSAPHVLISASGLQGE